ncbi:MAG TPA: FAD-binding oxidoreductase [Anaerolineaceae bacterium]|nr:FAD-binding oxidoreductase [Anaerolineaceae bacterium]
MNRLSFSDLRTGLEGRVITPDDTEYDVARTVFYGGFDRHPALIVRAKNAADVARTIHLARESGLDLAVRSGGHSLAGHSVSEGGIVLDLSEMRALGIDVHTKTAWAETGLTAGEYTKAAGEYNLATGFGDTGSVGIGGITMGGGIGFLVRKYGLTIDDLLGADMVTADGEVLRVDAENHPDLFWAIRGGGGNFGVATRFKFRLHEVDSVVGGMLMLPATAQTIASFMAEAEAAPDELSAIANILPAPPMPFIPPELHGKMIMMTIMVYAGPVEAGERAVAPFRSFTQPLMDQIKPMRYPEIYQPEQEGYHPLAASRSMFLDTVDLHTAENILDHLRGSTAQMAVAQLRALGGAMARVPVEETAFAFRNRRIMANIAALYTQPDQAAEQEAFITEFADSLRQGEPGVYVNFLGNEGEDRIREAYPAATWDRLVAVKKRYDPTNLFHLNHNIPPVS